MPHQGSYQRRRGERARSSQALSETSVDQARGCSSPAISVENSKSALSPYLASKARPNASELPDPVPTLYSGAKPNIAPLTVVGDPSGPVYGSKAMSVLPATLIELSVILTMARSIPAYSPISGLNSPNGPPASPDTICSTALACSSEAPSSTTIPTFQFPAVRFDGNQL